MIIIGEKLNSSVGSTLKAFKDGDEEHVVSLIRSQHNIWTSTPRSARNGNRRSSCG